jgi:phage protein D
VSASAVISARPTFSVGGRTRPSLTGGLLDLRIREHVHGLSSCEATFGNWGAAQGSTGFLYFDRQTLDFGKDLAVSFLGRRVFTGRITGLEAGYYEASPPTLTVLVEDRYQDLRMTRRTRTWEQIDDAEVMRQIAGEHGLTPDIDVRGPQHAVIAQVDQSDLAFLRDRARTIDAELSMDDRTLTVRSHAARAGSPLKLALGSGVRSFTSTADLAGQRTALDVTGWDVAAKSALRESATDAVLGAELKGGESGAGVLGSALGQRKEAVVHGVPLTSGEARATAEALYRQRLRRFVSGRGVAEPNPSLRPGAWLRIDGLGPLFTGEFYVTEVSHVFDGVRGLRSEFAVERAGLGGAAA